MSCPRPRPPRAAPVTRGSRGVRWGVTRPKRAAPVTRGAPHTVLGRAAHGTGARAIRCRGTRRILTGPS
eukprot:3767569-Prymnesium_polylepis.1